MLHEFRSAIIWGKTLASRFVLEPLLISVCVSLWSPVAFAFNATVFVSAAETLTSRATASRRSSLAGNFLFLDVEDVFLIPHELINYVEETILHSENDVSGTIEQAFVFVDFVVENLGPEVVSVFIDYDFELNIDDDADARVNIDLFGSGGPLLASSTQTKICLGLQGR